jgi:plasmid stability protein
MIQIRDVPDDLHWELETRAAQQGMSLSDYLKRELGRIAETPTLEEMFERIRRREPTQGTAESIVEIIRAHRDA